MSNPPYAGYALHEIDETGMIGLQIAADTWIYAGAPRAVFTENLVKTSQSVGVGGRAAQISDGSVETALSGYTAGFPLDGVL
jgi:hypothetical protein